MAVHKCGKECKGQKYNGLKINCHRCKGPTKIECIDELHEIKNFLIFFEIGKYESLSTEKKRL